ncbi:ATP-binding cassette domain-containing protein [Streptomyces calidiresistens]|uniref:ATP-binding cassette domain-containing protein n=2 Tax=Streptomyces calidiresistens TaxID=1485586 RepID=A0A7W3T4E9_9ACTN|nr:ATP-binding cassette domain-containing protein [Streptomyces calidiresistens]
MPIQYVNCSFGYSRRGAVLSSLDFTFPSGNTVLLGPNGAGKSTLLKIGSSALLPRKGSVRLGELDTRSRRDRGPYRRRVAWMPQNIDCVPGLRVVEQVAYAGWLKGLGKDAAAEKASWALAQVDLTHQADSRVSELSGGQLRRVGVARALVHDAEVLLLDEPTAGMDPRQRRVFHKVLGGLRGRIDIVLSTHDVADLETTYDSVVVMLGGRIHFRGDVSEFLEKAPPETPAGRVAEAAYHGVTEGASPCLS